MLHEWDEESSQRSAVGDAKVQKIPVGGSTQALRTQLPDELDDSDPLGAELLLVAQAEHLERQEDGLVDGLADMAAGADATRGGRDDGRRRTRAHRAGDGALAAHRQRALARTFRG